MDYFSNLKDAQYMNLTTFRKSGTAVTTPVWFVQEDHRIFVMTDPGTGKHKRISNNPCVQIALSDMQGKQLGESVQAMARIVSVEELNRAEKMISKKYGIMYKIIMLRNRLQGAKTGRVCIEITPP